MKIITATYGADGRLSRVHTKADSAILRSGDPLFVADHLGEWTGRICPAVRISRLGTNIPLKVAGRYFDSFAPVLTARLHPESAYPEGICDIADRTVAPGEWIPAENLADEATEITVTAGGTTTDVRAEGLRSLFERTIHELSRYCTFKTGDIIIVDTASSAEFPLIPDTSVECHRAGSPCLKVRLK